MPIALVTCATAVLVLPPTNVPAPLIITPEDGVNILLAFTWKLPDTATLPLNVTPAAFAIVILLAVLEVNNPAGTLWADVPLNVTMPAPVDVMVPEAVITVPPKRKVLVPVFTIPVLKLAEVSTLKVFPNVTVPLTDLLTIKFATPLLVGLVV